MDTDIKTSAKTGFGPILTEAIGFNRGLAKNGPPALERYRSFCYTTVKKEPYLGPLYRPITYMT